MQPLPFYGRHVRKRFVFDDGAEWDAPGCDAPLPHTTAIATPWYRKGELIGRGTYANVYAAAEAEGRCDADLVYNKAMKVIDVSGNPGQDGCVSPSSDRRRALLEAAVLQGLAHRNIIQLDALLVSDRSVTFVMDKIEVSAKQLIQATSLALPDVKSVISQLLSALRYMHYCGVAHRDVKTENIMVHTNPSPQAQSPRYHVQLIDMGLCCVVPCPATPTQRLQIEVCGTVKTMSPELLTHLADPQGTPGVMLSASVSQLFYYDLFAVGVFAFGLLCGHPPFRGGCPAELLASCQRGDASFRAAPKYNRLSQEAKSFLCDTLLSDEVTVSTSGGGSSLYPSADDVLRHPFVSGSEVGSVGWKMDECSMQRCVELHAQVYRLSQFPVEEMQACVLDEGCFPGPHDDNEGYSGAEDGDADSADSNDLDDEDDNDKLIPAQYASLSQLHTAPSPADEPTDFEMFSAVGSCATPPPELDLDCTASYDDAL